MTETKLEYIAVTNINTEPVWLAGKEPTAEQEKQIENMKLFVDAGQVIIKKATKRTRKAKEQ